MRSNRRKVPDSIRDEVFSQTGGACYYCGYAATDIDHIVPYSYNANNVETNLVPACSICNRIAGNKHFDSLQEKKDYILAERKTLKWERRFGRMVVTVISPATLSMPQDEKPAKAPRKIPRPVSGQDFDSVMEKPTKPKALVIKPSKSKPPKTIKSPGPTYDYVEDDLEEFVLSLPRDKVDTLVAIAIWRGEMEQRGFVFGPEAEEQDFWEPLCIAQTELLLMHQWGQIKGF